MERPKVGVAILVVKDGQALLGKRKNAHGEGQWASPGGHLEFGETIETCVKRELMEETGLVPLSQKQGPWTNDLFGPKHYITCWVFVPEFEGTVELKEPHKCEVWGWFDWDDLPEPLFLPMQNLIRQVGIAALKKKTSLSAATNP
jgi:8-oxo-dGTP diphosphatase